MIITERERKRAQDLTKRFLLHKEKLSYANISTDSTYAGWVTDFRLRDSSGNKIHLDLKNGDDLFLLFVLAVAWSRTGSWENAAFFVAHLKVLKKNTALFWKDRLNCDLEKENNSMSAREIISLVSGIKPRKKISFRKDIYDSVHVLATEWDLILDRLRQSQGENNFYPFMDHMRSIPGLGAGKKKMLIKIPLILRELRCQNIYSGIPGKYCCVPDARVYEAAKALEIKLPLSVHLDGLEQSSSKIYSLFGDLYDLPLFAHKDLSEMS